ncbi:MAG: hypothetical protein QOH84_2389 [Kribbellaceae bacterium]|nr:hypothetical protein [Kribbellaceae bacterium]
MDPNEALEKFLLHVVGVPGVIVSVITMALKAKDWYEILHALYVGGPEAARRAAKVVRSGPKRLMVATILAQTGLIAGTYVFAHFFYSMVLREDRQTNPPFDYDEIWRSALVRDHWNAFSFKVVLGAIAFVVLIDILCVTTSNREKKLAAIGAVAGTLGLFVLFPGALVLLLGLVSDGEYPLGDAGMYALWAGLLYGWGKLVRWSCEFPRLVVDRAPGRVHEPRRRRFQR